MNRQRNKVCADAPVLTIGKVAEILKVHQRTLRIYDEQNLLVPKRSKQNRRLYSLNDIERGRLIQFLTRNLAINLAGVKIILQLLSNSKIKPELYIQYVNDAAKSAKIDKKVQAYNAERLSKRGKKINQNVCI